MSQARKLTRAEKRQIEAAIAKAKRQDKRQLSAQDSIPFQRMYPDGICRVTDTYFTKTIQYQDINYQLSQNEDKTTIFDGWCDFLNYFDSSVKFQLSFVNKSATKDNWSKSISIPLQGDNFDSIRREYTEMLQNQLARGNNGLVKTDVRHRIRNAQNGKTQAGAYRNGHPQQFQKARRIRAVSEWAGAVAGHARHFPSG